MTSEAAVHQEVHAGPDGDVLVLVIDNPPVNASSAAVRAGLLAGIERLGADGSLVAGVVMGARGTFVSGSDISEFDGPVPEPLLPTVIAAIEACPAPVVAALDGYALGGGLELALGCDHRVGTAAVQLGMPEVGLGMVPGAGGTQRLPRLVGPVAALDLILTGRRIGGPEALELGLLDAVTDRDLVEEAVAVAARAPKRAVAQLPVPAVDEEAFAAAARTGLRRAGNRPNAVEAVELVRMAGRVPVADALVEERARFDRLRVGDEASALRHVFFAARAAARRTGVRPSSTALARAAVVGAGAMGSGIAAALAAAGADVRLVDLDAEQAERGRDRARQSLERAVLRGRLDGAAGERALAGLSVSDRLDDLGGVQLVVEAVVEDVEVKTQVLMAAQAASPGAVLATNTSYLGVEQLGVRLDDPSRLVGLHFFNPADVMRLVEVVPTGRTSTDVVAAVLRLVGDMGKQAVVVGDREGFLGNRLFAAYRRHAEYLLEDGALPVDVDSALEDFGLAMGPFAVADLSGLQIARSLRDRWRREGRLPARYVDVPDRLCDLGRLGRRTGAGYYAYDESGSRRPDDAVTALIEAESARKAIARRPVDTDEIVARTIGALVVEGARAVADGTARHVDDVDVVMVDGFGFPRYRGGPMHWARQLPEDQLVAMVSAVAAAAREPDDLGVVRAALGMPVAG